MCTAYQTGRGAGSVAARQQAAIDVIASGPERLIRPTLRAPVILPDGEVREMSWGFRRSFRGVRGPVTRIVVNSREDKLGGPMWWEAFRGRRCLIPATAFYEWVEGPGRAAVPLRFSAVDDAMLMIAGIWESGEKGPCFSMITTEPSESVRKVHDRMPAVLTDAQLDGYLDGDLGCFGPSAVELRHAQVDNFLRVRSRPADDQFWLF